MKVFVEYYERSIIENSLLIENFYPKSLSPVHISGTEVFYLCLTLSPLAFDKIFFLFYTETTFTCNRYLCNQK